MTHGVIDLFSGPRGWDVGLRMLGRDDSIGVENDATANATARANGFAAVDGDVSVIDPNDFADEHCGGQPDGLIASPVCTPFTQAGAGLGRDDMESILSVVQDIANGEDPDEVIPDVVSYCLDPLSPLSLEPLRWALALRPRWLAWEQVSQIMPLWAACADVLRAKGYQVYTGPVHAEQFGVPQTRRREILIARLDCPVSAPVPVTSKYYPRDPKRLDVGVPSWVSMAEALSYEGAWAMRSNYGSGGDPAARGMRGIEQPAPTVTSKIDRNVWVPRAANPDTTEAAMQWVYSRPSPTIVGSFRPDVVAAPGYRKAGDPPRQRTPGSVHVTTREAATLQSFPADHVFCGKNGAVYKQIGNAVPPVLAMHVLRAAGAIQ